MEETLGIEASIRGSKVLLHGNSDAVTRAEKLIRELYAINSNGYTISPEDIKYALRAIENREPGWNAVDLVGTSQRVSAGLLGPVVLREYLPEPVVVTP